MDQYSLADEKTGIPVTEKLTVTHKGNSVYHCCFLMVTGQA
jgi:hypothetical protein